MCNNDEVCEKWGGENLTTKTIISYGLRAKS